MGSGRNISTDTGTGQDVFIALSKLDELLCEGGYGIAVEGIPLNELSAVVAPHDLAFIPDFMIVPGARLCSELFTARAVASLLVNLCVSEEIIVEDEEHGYGVRLRDYSPR